MVKAIFFDIDGTLLDFKTNTVPQSTQWEFGSSLPVVPLVKLPSERKAATMLYESRQSLRWLNGCSRHSRAIVSWLRLLLCLRRSLP